MITRKKFNFIKEKYGKYASWAVWADPDAEKPKSNMGDLTVLDPEINKDLLSQLNPNAVLVALNFSRGSVENSFGNFHSNYPYATDYKTRFALRDTPFWGAYMTDIIKDFDDKESGNVVSFLRNNKSFEKENVESFLQELRDIGATKPFLVAFGDAVFDILEKNLNKQFEIKKIPHYAHFISKEKYRKQVKTILFP